MKFRTCVKLKPSGQKITYNTPVILLGSCFAAEIGAKFRDGRMPVMINPFGVLYNPESVAESLLLAIENREFGAGDLELYNNRYFSFYHGTSFSGTELSVVVSGVNESIRETTEFLKNSRMIFVTFGTAWIYKWKKSGKVVSNCHKLPSSEFERILLGAEEIIMRWESTLERLKNFNPDLKVVFTVSPVRHLKDGFHENQISKSVLHLAIKELMGHETNPGYFPSYEIVLDELRDYRFYADDMVHPSGLAVEYIWEKFKGCYFRQDTIDVYKKVLSVSRARHHRFLSDNEPEKEIFRKSMLGKILEINSVYPFVNLSDDIAYFKNL